MCLMLSRLTFTLLLGDAGNYNQGEYAVEKGQKESAFHCSIGGLCHHLMKIKSDLRGVCLSVCERQREGTDVPSHMWLQSVFLVVLPHSLPSRMTPDCFRHLQGLSKQPGLCPLLQTQITI